jgi:hypothetical protein
MATTELRLNRNGTSFLEACLNEAGFAARLEQYDTALLQRQQTLQNPSLKNSSESLKVLQIETGMLSTFIAQCGYINLADVYDGLDFKDDRSHYEAAVSNFMHGLGLQPEYLGQSTSK